MTKEEKQLDDERSRVSDLYNYLIAGLTVAVAGGYVLVMGLLLSHSLRSMGKDSTLLGGAWALLNDMSLWFDPIFFQYNLLLLSIVVALPPLITVFYVVGMREEKKRRLKLEMPQEWFVDDGYNITRRIDENFRLRHYLGSMSMLTLLVLMGSTIILLLKPLPIDAGSQLGVDYSKGANFLMLGPNMEYFVNGDVEGYMSSLIGTLSAFQFGFLGAYVYFMTHLVRSYFTLDLTPNTFVASSVRIMMGSVLALVCAFLFLQDYKAVIPILSFCIGFFPQRGLLFIEKFSNAIFNKVPGVKGMDQREDAATALSQLPGMSYAHELRLQREGFDNVENLAHADAVDLAVRTGFSYGQLCRWISEARLMRQLGSDYQDFFRATGLSSVIDIRQFIEKWQMQNSDREPTEILMEAVKPEIRHKCLIVCALETSKTET